MSDITLLNFKQKLKQTISTQAVRKQLAPLLFPINELHPENIQQQKDFIINGIEFLEQNGHLRQENLPKLLYPLRSIDATELYQITKQLIKEYEEIEKELSTYLKYLYMARLKLPDKFYIDSLIDNIWKSKDSKTCLEKGKATITSYCDKLKETVMNGLTLKENDQLCLFNLAPYTRDGEKELHTQLIQKYIK